MADLSVRLSQTLSPFGVGAIYDVLGESFVACDTRLWKARGRTLRAPRLERKLHVQKFREAPSRGSIFGAPTPGIPYVRFPRWLFCASCRRMTHWSMSREQPGEPPKCVSCGSRRPLVPMRFVMICSDGHLADVPWHRWAHSDAESPDQKQCFDGPMQFIAKAASGGGLASLVVRCLVPRCRASRSLAGLTASGSMRQLGVKCRGLQPWQVSREALEHDRTPEVVQRGASNVHFPRIESAIDIPPESRFSAFSDLALSVSSHGYFAAIVSNPTNPVVAGLIEGLAAQFGVTPALIRQIVDAEVDKYRTTHQAVSGPDIPADEWAAFVTPMPETDSRDHFVTRHIQLDTSSMGASQAEVVGTLVGSFANIVLATRLREVRALTGFSRYDPGGAVVPPDLGRGERIDWLPALEVFGEGIFLSLREQDLQLWERGRAAKRAATIEVRRGRSTFGVRLPVASPRLVLLHTLAHLLIRQLAFDAGYSSASLRERIYAREPSSGAPMAGLLIYTAAGDAEGTLGGLVRQGEPERLAASLLGLLQASMWCSNDPICGDSAAQGVDGLNRAACHACALISETSCVLSNALLDRALVVGRTGESYFESQMQLALGHAAGPA